MKKIISIILILSSLFFYGCVNSENSFSMEDIDKWLIQINAGKNVDENFICYSIDSEYKNDYIIDKTISFFDNLPSKYDSENPTSTYPMLGDASHNKNFSYIKYFGELSKNSYCFYLFYCNNNDDFTKVLIVTENKAIQNSYESDTKLLQLLNSLFANEDIETKYYVNITNYNNGTIVGLKPFYLKGDKVELTAIPNLNYKFVHFKINDIDLCFSNTYSFYITENSNLVTTIEVLFQPDLKENSDGYIEIKNIADFSYISQFSNKKYILKNDIDFNGQILNISIDNEFNGNGYSLKNIDNTNSKKSSSVFVSNRGTIKNLSLENVKSNGSLFVYTNEGIISNCRLSGIITAQQLNIGTFCHENSGYLRDDSSLIEGIIKNCYSAVSVFREGNLNVGFVAYAGKYSRIQNCIINDSITKEESMLMKFTPLFIEKYNYDSDDVKFINNYVSNEYSINNVKIGNSLSPIYYSIVDTNNLKDKNFYITTLNWSDLIWDFTNVTLNGYPLLKKSN